MAKARFVSGNVTMAPYTPSGADVEAGDIVLLGDYTAVAHLPIAEGELGNVAIFGGIYELEKDGTGGPVFDLGEDVDWDASGKQAVEAAGGNGFGFAVAAAGTNDATVLAFHMPNGLADGT